MNIPPNHGKVSPSGKSSAPRIMAPILDVIRIVAGNQLYIDKSGLPQQLINRLIRTAAFRNPEYFLAQALRLPLFDNPRVIACAENFQRHVGLPRGCLDEVVELLDSLNIRHGIVDERYSGEPIRTRFLGTLNTEQQSAAKAILRHDIGILSATTGFGKPVLVAHGIAKRKRTTLVLVHREHLIFMQCGPLQYRVSAKKQAGKRRFSHFVIPRYTDFQLSTELFERYKHIPIQAVYGEIANDDIRNRMIIADVVSAVNNNRSPIIITERKAHVTYLSDHLSGAAEHILVLQGGMGSKANRAILAEMESIKDDASRILIATGRYIGEGFDDARLDTLFLAMPIS